MPIYTFQDKETKEKIEVLLKMSEVDQYLLNNDHLTKIIDTPTIVRDVGTNLKVSDGFREGISKIKETYKINNIKSY